MEEKKEGTFSDEKEFCGLDAIDVENIEFVTSIMEVMATMGRQEDIINTKYIANIASVCSGKLKRIYKRMINEVYRKE